MQFYQTPKEAAHRLTRVLRRLETTQGTSRAAVLVESKHFGWDVLKVLQEEFPERSTAFLASVADEENVHRICWNVALE